MSKIVPLISSGIAGPLGVLHLPRLWQKVLLESLGQLADGYPGIGKGYDMYVINGLGLNADAVKKFIATKPNNFDLITINSIDRNYVFFCFF